MQKISRRKTNDCELVAGVIIVKRFANLFSRSISFVNKNRRILFIVYAFAQAAKTTRRRSIANVRLNLTTTPRCYSKYWNAWVDFPVTQKATKCKQTSFFNTSEQWTKTSVCLPWLQFKYTHFGLQRKTPLSRLESATKAVICIALQCSGIASLLSYLQ